MNEEQYLTFLKQTVPTLQRNKQYPLWHYKPEWEPIFDDLKVIRNPANDGIEPFEFHIEQYTQQKFNTGEYTPVSDKFPIEYGTGAHISTQNPSMIAYYPDFKHVKAKRAVQTRPGRYLAKYFPDIDPDEIRELAGLFNSASLSLEFFNDWEDMRKYYNRLEYNGIVESCMSGKSWDYDDPFIAYHNSDVILAVLFNEGGDPLARALCNKNTKQFPMIYGQWKRMLPKLENAGYTHGSLHGAKVNKHIEEDDYGNMRLIMPYIDGHRTLGRRDVHNNAYITINEDHCIIVDDDGDYPAGCTDGYICLEEDEKRRVECEHCGSIEYDDDVSFYPILRSGQVWSHSITLCSPCVDDHVHIVYTRGQDYAEYVYCDSSELIEIDDQYYADSVAAEYHGFRYVECYDCWYPEDEVVWSDHEGEYIPNADAVFALIDKDNQDYIWKDNAVKASDGVWFLNYDVAKQLNYQVNINDDLYPEHELIYSEYLEEYILYTTACNCLMPDGTTSTMPRQHPSVVNVCGVYYHKDCELPTTPPYNELIGACA